jgi:glycosyltransferase involved in cell wall biosynthesis
VNIALVSRRYPPLIGGAEKVLSYLARGFAESGWETRVLTSRLERSLAAREEEATAGGRLIVERLATRRLRFVGTWQYMRGLRRWFEEHRVGAAYVSMLKHDAYVVVECGRRLGFPVVLRPEGAGATGDLAWQSWGRFGRRIGARCRTADAYVAISPAIRRELELAGYDPRRIHDIPNGVPVPLSAWRQRGTAGGPRVAVYTGRLAEEKGLDVLIAAWPMVQRSHPGCRLILVGEGPMRRMLEEQAGALGVREVIEFRGAVADVTETLREADLYVLPSREEGMSIALLEAMALGMPVVASDIPGNRGIIRHGKTGMLVAAGEPEALARGIHASWEGYESACARGRRAREDVAARFSIASVVRKHIELFESLLAERNAGPERERGGAC